MEKVKELELLFSKEDLKILELCKEHKLSVSGVKYSRGHDGDCMECNLKVGSRIKGHVWDDSWGGEYDYQGEDVKVALDLMDTIIKNSPNMVFNGEDLGSFNYDTIVSLMVKDFEIKKTIKKKTYVIGVKEKPENEKTDYMYKQEFTYNCEYGENGINDEKIIKDFTNDGFYAIQIINKLYI